MSNHIPVSAAARAPAPRPTALVRRLRPSPFFLRLLHVDSLFCYLGERRGAARPSRVAPRSPFRPAAVSVNRR